MRLLPFFIVKIAGNFRWLQKLRLSTENFGSWGSNFPDYMEQSFSPTQQDESCVIRAGWRNSAERLVTVWRTFSDEGKICPGWWGWGVHAHPLSLHLPSPVKLQCTLQLCGQIHWPCFISTNICTLCVCPQVGPYRKCCHVPSRSHGHVF
jgi:hypothetical protein